MTAQKILIVDDEPDIAELVSYNLKKAGYAVFSASDGEEALSRVREDRFDLIVLDLMLPGIHGMELCRILRNNVKTARIPIIMLTAKGEETDKISGLEIGADDFMTKPFSPKELIARVKAVLRRSGELTAAKETIVLGDLLINLETFTVLKQGAPLSLSAKEFKLLLYLVQHRGRVFSRDQLLDAVWEDETFVEPRTVNVHIRRLRTQIEDNPSNPVYVRTRRGIGYYVEDCMKHGIFRRIFLLYAVIILISFFFIESSVTSTIRDHYIDGLNQNLIAQASLIADRVPFHAVQNIDEACKAAKEKTGARVTVIALDGRVLGDSDADSSSMENHAHRPEVQQAALSGTGMFIRHSDTVKQDLMYVAYRMPSRGKPEGYVRLSVPLQNIDHAVNVIRLNIILAVGFVIIVSAAFSFWQFDYLRRLTQQIKGFAGSLIPRGIGSKLVLQDAGEFSDIADSLNAMSLELKTVIEEHEQERKRLNEILRSIPDALLIIDSKGVVLLSSAATRNFFGDAPLIGRPFIQVLRNSEFFALLDEVRASRTAGVSEFKLEYPAERHCVVRISPLFYNKDVLSGFVAIFHDITELKKVEQVRKDFVANASHEIKTPITAIKGFADTLLEGALEDRAHALKFLRAIKSNSERINSLVDNLMTISKIEMGVMKIEKVPVKFIDAAEAVLAILKDRAAAKNLTLQIAVKPGLQDISADRDRLIQILTNLVENGIKFTEQGGVTFGMIEEDGRSTIVVEDTGVGIPQKHLARLGERFYRVDPSRSRQMGGTGLGLAIVKHLVKAHGWDMQIESVQEKGTKVKIIVT